MDDIPLKGVYLKTGMFQLQIAILQFESEYLKKTDEHPNCRKIISQKNIIYSSSPPCKMFCSSAFTSFGDGGFT